MRRFFSTLFKKQGGVYTPLRVLDLDGGSEAGGLGLATPTQPGLMSAAVASSLSDGTAHTISADVAPGSHSNAGASGAVTLTLADVTAGARYRFVVLAAQNLVIKAPTGTTIRVGASVTADGGTVTSDTIGACLVIVAEATGVLVAESALEVW